MKAKGTPFFNIITQNPISARRAWFRHIASHIYPYIHLTLYYLYAYSKNKYSLEF